MKLSSSLEVEGPNCKGEDECEEEGEPENRAHNSPKKIVLVAKVVLQEVLH